MATNLKGLRMKQRPNTEAVLSSAENKQALTRAVATRVEGKIQR